MKYIVEVNAKWLVNIEAESALGAEHAALELDGVWGALAFDEAGMKTETFAGAVQTCETIKADELELFSKAYADAYAAKAKAEDAYKAADAEVERIEKTLADAKAAREGKRQAIYDAAKAIALAQNALGFRPE